MMMIMAMLHKEAIFVKFRKMICFFCFSFNNYGHPFLHAKTSKKLSQSY